MNKVFLTGLLTAILIAIAPVLQGDKITVYSLAFPVLLAVGSYLSRNLEGQVVTIIGIITAAATNFFTAHPAPDGITLKYVVVSWVLPLVIQVLTANSKAIGPDTKK
jgi:hypothetical protein